MSLNLPASGFLLDSHCRTIGSPLGLLRGDWASSAGAILPLWLTTFLIDLINEQLINSVP